MDVNSLLYLTINWYTGMDMLSLWKSVWFAIMFKDPSLPRKVYFRRFAYILYSFQSKITSYCYSWL